MGSCYEGIRAQTMRTLSSPQGAQEVVVYHVILERISLPWLCFVGCNSAKYTCGRKKHIVQNNAEQNIELRLFT